MGLLWACCGLVVGLLCVILSYSVCFEGLINPSWYGLMMFFSPKSWRMNRILESHLTIRHLHVFSTYESFAAPFLVQGIDSAVFICSACSFSWDNLSWRSLPEMGLSENRLNPYTQWFVWSLSLWKMAISLGIYPIFRQTQMESIQLSEFLGHLAVPCVAAAVVRV